MQAFPTEILQHIFTFLPVQDIVCSSFQQASQDRHVWSTVYKYCRLPRLPGPFLGHTALYLENYLIQSAKLQRNWASSPQVIVKPLYTQTFHWPLSDDVHGSLLIGPWLIVAASRHIICYNVDSGNHDGSVMYDASQFRIYAFSAVGPQYSGEQHSAYLIVQEMDDSKRVVKMLQLLIPDHQSTNIPTLELLSEQQVNFLHRFGATVGPRCFAAAPMYLEDDHTNVYVMDTKHRRRLYLPARFESMHPVNQPTLPPGSAFSTLLVCSSHVLVLRTVPRRIRYCSSFVNAFQLPSDEDVEHGSSTLQMTHSGVFPDIGFMDVTCLRDSVVDGTTGSTVLTLIGHARAPTYQSSRTVDIVRLELTTDGRILMPECRTLVELDCGFTIHLQCFQGCGRGLLEGFMSSKRRLAISVDDTDQDSPIMISNIETSPRAQILGFDGIGGRICQRLRENEMELEVVNFI
ncbi:hypothetical protein AZE42_05917 [Rhizopogon vesiculosus]|uniref:F-box domain-containing protein n=1 Tax=Rhizopogon vesiculosus TaxID=180088 RepID=A0A1J8R6E3_9AGAM|nr:hypothetical protein AZE42_05917 [Rhizopogon vesiculosus]